VSRVVETARLRLRPADETDVVTLHRIWTDPEVRRYLWDGRVIDQQVAADVVLASVRDWNAHGFGLWVIEHRETGEPIGFVGFRAAEDGQPELLFGLVPHRWQRGFATEASRAALDHVFMNSGVRSVSAATDMPNAASVRVLERIGLRFRRRDTLNGLDTLFYGLSRDE
jgi:ribosomal-protein-alanine N-acetyltransferase